MLRPHIEPGVFCTFLVRSESNWLIRKSSNGTQPASVGTIPVSLIPFHDKSSTSNVDSVEGPLGTPRPADNFSFHRYPWLLVVSRSKSYGFAEASCVTALVLLNEWGQFRMIELLCFC